MYKNNLNNYLRSLIWGLVEEIGLGHKGHTKILLP